MLDLGIVTMGVALGFSLAGLWLRLRFQLKAERERRRYLLTAATALPSGSRIHDQRGDGTYLTLTVGDAPPSEDLDE
jgi:hypothetical protein